MVQQLDRGRHVRLNRANTGQPLSIRQINNCFLETQMEILNSPAQAQYSLLLKSFTLLNVYIKICFIIFSMNLIQMLTRLQQV